MIGEQEQSEQGGSVTLSVKIPKWMSELLNLIAKGKGDDVNANHLLSLCLQFIVETAKCNGPVPIWMRMLLNMLKLDASWHKAFNFASTECTNEIAQVILVLQQHDGKKPREGFGLALINRPFMGEASVTYCVDDILERVVEVSMRGLYNDLREIGKSLDSQSLRETLTMMCDAQKIAIIEDSDRNELPGYGDRHDYGHIIEYGQKHRRKPHRTPDSVANAQQKIVFTDDDKQLADEEAGHKAEPKRDEGLGFRPFGEEE